MDNVKNTKNTNGTQNCKDSEKKNQEKSNAKE
jgi:hypothetical protein